eukprot:6880062-Karenia_brevis.AAC.1
MIIWRPKYDHPKVILGSSGVISESSGDHFRIILKSFWDHMDIILGPSGGLFKIIWGSFEDHLGVLSRSSGFI